GRNVFLTGEPGSGKTHTVNRYVSYLRSCGITPAITASTGIAATHIGGVTIHSWSGIGVSHELSDDDLERISEMKHVVKNMKGVKILIIDEVSMISADMMGMVDMVCREIKGIDRPFGGLQVVLVGDFFQLPPIIKRDEYIDEVGARFAYESPSWKELDPDVCYLSEQHRQDSASFAGVLSAIRSGEVSNRHRSLLESRKLDHVAADKDRITKLFSHNVDVDRINDMELAKISGIKKSFQMESRGPRKLVEQIKRGCLSPEALELKIDARVMFTKNNFEAGFVNGTTGIVVGFDEETGHPKVKTDKGALIVAAPMAWAMESDGDDLASVTQIPLRLAWAITIHKSQGMSLDNAVIDLSRAFEYGQGYVALSRVRSLEGVYLVGLNDRALQVCPEVSEQDVVFREQSDDVSGELIEADKEEILKRQIEFVSLCGGEIPRGDESENKKVSAPKKGYKGSTHTLELLSAGKTIEEIAKETGFVEGTIFKHLETLKNEGELNHGNTAHLRKGKEKEIAELTIAFMEVGVEKLTPVFCYFNGRIPYSVIRLARILYEDTLSDTEEYIWR
ncbi:MAG: AAA family ATPase, partial [Candidatus Colwellbacteria bacterium]|nr:AAA family ATPase [Candidatus Colwellbacteria bacterium]